METAPRHIVKGGEMEIDDEKVPIELKGRLALETIEGLPPGEIPNHLKPNWDVKNYLRLTVICDNGTKVQVDYLDYLSFTTFKRQDGNMWYLCHTWTKTWGEGSRSGSTFINLSTGERYDVNSLSFWRGTLQISPDGNMILIDAGIMASSARKILVYDISCLPKMETIHYEEFWYGIQYSVSFNENNEYVCTYFYGEDDDEQNIKREICVLRKRDSKREIVNDQRSEYETKVDEIFETGISVNKMIEVERSENRIVSLKHEILQLLNDQDFSTETYEKVLTCLKSEKLKIDAH